MEAIQLSLAKGILGVRPSTANVVVYTELGFKPISLLISERKLRYVLSIMKPSYKGSEIVKVLMIQHLTAEVELLSGPSSPLSTD